MLRVHPAVHLFAPSCIAHGICVVGQGCKGVYGCAGARHTHQPVVRHQPKWHLATSAWRALCKSFLRLAIQLEPSAVWELCLYNCAYPFACTLYAWTFYACTICLHMLCLLDYVASLLLLSARLTGWLACWLLVCLLSHLITSAPAMGTNRILTSELRLV